MENIDEAIVKVRNSINSLPDQCEQAWDESRKMALPQEYETAENIVVCGMGGSGLPTHFITSVFATRVPTVLVNTYDLPFWVNEKTLVVLSSYSGDTQETLSCARQAKEHKCMVVGVTSGGKLAQYLNTNSYPAYVFDPIHNSSGKPRLGLGYSIFGQLAILDKLGFIQAVGDGLPKIVPESVLLVRSELDGLAQQAGEFWVKLMGKGILIFAANHLVGNAHIFANQLNESAKTFAVWFALPEADHHLLEGLKYPKENLAGLFLVSSAYDPLLKKRFSLTRQVVEKNNFPTFEYQPTPKNLLAEALEVLQFTSFLSLELATANNENPLEIPWVDWFKKQLSK